MGTVVEFPRKDICRSSARLRPSRNVLPALQIADDPPSAPGDEFAQEFEEGTRVARYEILSRAEFLALGDACRAGPPSFAEVQRCAFVQREPAAAAAPFREFVAYMTGRQGGGVLGSYSRSLRTGFAVLELFVRDLH